MDVNTVAVVIPTHPWRNMNGMLQRALNSVVRQTRQPDEWSIAHDSTGAGSAATRNRALNAVTAKWSAFLDSDDEWLPDHLETLLQFVQLREGTTAEVDVVYTGCHVVGPQGEEIPRHDEWGRFGRDFNPYLLRQLSYIPVTSLVRTDLAQSVGGFIRPADSPYDDWGFYLRMLDAGARFMHIPKVTWVWHHHGMNTSGQPDRGDAR